MGELGWTKIPLVFNFFEICPTTLEHADQLALKHIEKFGQQEWLKDLFFEMKIEDIKEDLESAINCFNIKEYKEACALLLFINMDRILIQKQKGKNKKVGLGAIKKLSSLKKMKK